MAREQFARAESGSDDPLGPGSPVTVVHAVVAGRSRLAIAGLKHGGALARWLEAALPGVSGIRSAKASTTTGNLLVHHDPTLPAGEVASLVARCALAFRPGTALPVVVARSSGIAWHALEIEAVLSRLGSSETNGLARRMADQRLRDEGPNALTEMAKRSRLALFAAQFKTLPVGILTGSALLSLATGGAAEAIVILSVVVANAYVGYGTERLAEITIGLLAKMGPAHVVVLRDGSFHTVLAEDIAVGDLLVLVPGMYVPADARLLRAESFTVDESSLTGESLPVQKEAARLSEDTPLAERRNMVYRGTVVTGGNAMAIVVATGDRTEIGRIRQLVAESKPSETPLQKQLEKLSTQLVSTSGVVAGGVLVAGVLRGYGLFEMLKTSVSLAIAAVPEGLPTVATTTLAQNALRMRKRNVLVRNLHAVEGLGSANVVCLDKTGTLTMNRMTAVALHAGLRHVDVRRGKVAAAGREEVAKLFEVAVLCNEAELDESAADGARGSQTEAALLRLASENGVDIGALRAELPVEKIEHRSEDKSYMATFHALAGERRLVAVKGNPTEVLGLCASYLEGGKVRKLGVRARAAIRRANDEMGGKALRVLGFAVAEAGTGPEGRLPKLTWLGLVGIADVTRDGVRSVLAKLSRAGVKGVMLTGDQNATALAIARQLDLSRGEPLEVFDSRELDRMAPAELSRAARTAHVFSRVSPADKLRIVRALREDGKIVAMAGDGINDAPALRAADIGIAMGARGTEVAREVADVVLTDDNLESLIAAVELGRTTRAAIKKSVVFLLATNLSESLIVFGGIATGLGHALNPLQLLWINLVSDVFPALALALEPPESDVLHQPPPAVDDPLLGRRELRRIFGEASILTASSLAVYACGVARYGAGARAQTMAFTHLTAAQLLHTLSCRSEKSTIFDRRRLASNPYVPLSIGLGVALQGVALGVPGVRRMLGSAPLGAGDLAACGVSAVAGFVAIEALRFLRLKGENHDQVEQGLSRRLRGGLRRGIALRKPVEGRPGEREGKREARGEVGLAVV